VHELHHFVCNFRFWYYKKIYICTENEQKGIYCTIEKTEMTKRIHFHKMHGAGNDYIYVNTMICPIDEPEAMSVRWSAPHTGIGADGLVLIGASEKADFHMRIFNADGSEALMCGNAVRCIGKYVYDLGLTRKTDVSLETLSGIRNLRLHVSNGKVEEVTVDMGCPDVDGETTEIEAGGRKYEGLVVTTGNPHFVIFTDGVEALDLAAIGPPLEHHPLFPNRTNVEFAEIREDGEIRMRVWERGSGITQACGTGACATHVAAVKLGRAGRRSLVRMDGGCLTVEQEEETGRVWMTGDAVMVYEGDIVI
jgi:diaminopimelate epimerase